MPDDAFEIGHFELDRDAITRYVVEKMREGKRIEYYQRYFKGIENFNLDCQVTDYRILFNDSPKIIKIHIDFTAMEHQWTVTGTVKATPDGKFTLARLRTLRCASPAQCHAEVHGGRIEFESLLIRKFPAHSVRYSYRHNECIKGYQHAYGPAASRVIEHVLARTTEKLPLDCNDCKHRLTCLLRPDARVSFELADDEEAKPNKN